MNDTTLYAAVEDLLTMCRVTTHTLNTGRHLAPLLIGRLWNEPDDDFALLAAIQTYLTAALIQRRQVLGYATNTTNGTIRGITQFQADCETNDLYLIRLSGVWAYYVDNLGNAQLAPVAKVSIRTMQGRIQEGRTQVVELLRQFNATTMAPTPNETPPTNGPIPAASPTATQLPPRPTIHGVHGPSVHGLGDGTVSQGQHGHQSPTPTNSSSLTDQRDSITFRIMLGISVIAGIVVLLIAPLTSIAGMLIVSSVYTLQQIVHLLMHWSRASSIPHERWWLLGTTIPWVIHTLLVALVSSRAAFLLSESASALGRIMVVVFSLVLLLELIWFVFNDLLGWMANATSVSAVLHWATRHAERYWNHRWWMLGTRWMTVGFIAGLALLNGYLWWS